MFERAVGRPRRRWRPLLALAAVSLVVVACGGGGGGGGGTDTDVTLRALVVNAAESDVAVTYTDADGVPTEQTVETCTAPVLEFPLTDPFQLAIDGTVIVDSAQLPEGLPGAGETDLVVKVDVAKDGTATFDSVRAGRSLSPPARSAYCPTLPG